MLLAVLFALLVGSSFLFIAQVRERDTFDHYETANRDLAYMWNHETSLTACFCGLLVGVLVGQFAGSALATGIGGATGIILWLLALNWHLRIFVWFRKFVALTVLTHAVAFAAIPWPADYELDYWAVIIIIADMLLLTFLLNVLEKKQQQ